MDMNDAKKACNGNAVDPNLTFTVETTTGFTCTYNTGYIPETDFKHGTIRIIFTTLPSNFRCAHHPSQCIAGAAAMLLR